ncbi:MAG TPA: hypothetical protein VLM79_23060 [Kofleriaceae bacterium]|nr:hypothetical protein [Kofleriaceae bacterium]
MNTATLEVVYSDIPDQAQAETAANYTIPGLTVKTASSAGDGTVTLVTDRQTNVSYMLTVANVTRAGDAQPLTTATATFVGKSTFNVVSAIAVDDHTFTVTFDAAPDPTQAIDKRSYGIIFGTENPYNLNSATLTLDGSTVTFSNAPQIAREPYFVFVSPLMMRASDGETLTVRRADFQGFFPYFFVSSAHSPGAFRVDVRFTDLAEPISATTLANYTIPGLTLSGTPTLSAAVLDSVVTLTTSAQEDMTYTVTVANVTRRSTGEALCCVFTQTFAGKSHCSDRMLDGDETDIDCGGSSCPKCASGKTCLVSTDCVSGTCNGGSPGTCM